MRVAVNAWFWLEEASGSGQYIRELASHLTADGEAELVLIAPANWLPKELPFPARCERIALPSSLPTNLAKLWFEQVGFPRKAAQLGANLIHVPYWAPPWYAPLPVVTTIHDLIPLLLPEYRGGPVVRLYTYLVRAAARRATLVLTDSEASRRDIITNLPCSPERVYAIPLAASDRYTPTPAADDRVIRSRYSLPSRYVFYLGGFDARKNLSTALRAYRRVVEAGRVRCPLVIAGRLPQRDTHFTPDPRRLAREQGLDEQIVQFIGYVAEPDKPALYRGADVFLFPSRYEGFGLPPLEALACGTPVVACNISSLPEVVGEGGLLVEPHDVDGMAEALTRLLESPALRSEMSQCALAQARRFSWQRTARETLAAFKAALRFS